MKILMFEKTKKLHVLLIFSLMPLLLVMSNRFKILLLYDLEIKSKSAKSAVPNLCYSF